MDVLVDSLGTKYKSIAKSGITRPTHVLVLSSVHVARCVCVWVCWSGNIPGTVYWKDQLEIREVLVYLKCYLTSPCRKFTGRYTLHRSCQIYSFYLAQLRGNAGKKVGVQNVNNFICGKRKARKRGDGDTSLAF